MGRGIVRRGDADGLASDIEFSVEPGEAIAAGRLLHPAAADPHRHRLAGLLRTLGVRQPGNRIPLAVPSSDRDLIDELEWTLSHDPAVRAGDPAWLRLEPCKLVRAENRDATSYLLTVQQASSLPDFCGVLSPVELPNEQIVEALVLEPEATGRPMPAILAKQSFAPPGLGLGKEEDGWWAFQSLPASDFRSVIPSTHAFHVVLHERFRKDFSGGAYLVLRNFELEARYPALDTRFPVRRCFTEEIDPTCAAVEETALLACGLREGEPCWLSRMEAPWWRRATPFAYRHIVCRVGPSTTVDQDKPLCRLPESALDVLGSAPGELVLIETLTHEAGRPLVVRRPLRALPERTVDDAPPLRGGAPDFFDEVGSVDLPMIRLDGTRQKQLGVTRGSPLYVRPRVLDYLLREASAVGLLLIGGVIATLAGDHLVLAIILTALLVAGALLRSVLVIRR